MKRFADETYSVNFDIQCTRTEIFDKENGDSLGEIDGGISSSTAFILVQTKTNATVSIMKNKFYVFVFNHKLAFYLD